MVYMFLANGFEETEALVPADLLMRANIDLKLVSVEDSLTVKGTHGICVQADMMIDACSTEGLEAVILPGGGPGTEALNANEKVRAFVKYANENDLLIAAICAAPSVFGRMGILEGKRFACYPGFEKYMPNGILTGNKVERDGKIITAQGMGVSFEFGFEIISALCGDNKVSEIKEQTRYDH